MSRYLVTPHGQGRPLTLYGDGSQTRDFTYVDDIARGTIAGLKRVGFDIFNLGSDKPVALIEAIHLIERLVGLKAEIVFKPRHPADVPATWADVTRASTKLGWKARTATEQGFENLVQWYRANRTWASDVMTSS